MRLHRPPHTLSDQQRLAKRARYTHVIHIALVSFISSFIHATYYVTNTKNLKKIHFSFSFFLFMTVSLSPFAFASRTHAISVHLFFDPPLVPSFQSIGALMNVDSVAAQQLYILGGILGTNCSLQCMKQACATNVDYRVQKERQPFISFFYLLPFTLFLLHSPNAALCHHNHNPCPLS